MSTLHEGLLAEMEKRGESLSEYKDFIRQIERVAPNYHYYYVNASYDKMLFPDVYKALDEIEALLSEKANETKNNT